MAQKIISVSISEGDKEFMRTRFLSPSRLLQERITQIRDEQDPKMLSRLKEANRKNEALKNKITFMGDRLEKFCRVLAVKMGKDEFNELLNNI